MSGNGMGERKTLSPDVLGEYSHRSAALRLRVVKPRCEPFNQFAMLHELNIPIAEFQS